MSKGNLISNTPAPQLGPSGYFVKYHETGGVCRIVATDKDNYMTVHASGKVNLHRGWETNFKGMLMAKAGKQLK